MQTITKPTNREPQIHEFRVSRKPLWRSAIEAAICLVLAVFALEVIFRITEVGGQEFLQMDHTLGTTHLPGKNIIWRMEGFSADTLNNLGYRDVDHTVSKPAGVKRIAVLGDSHSEGLQVQLEDTYARRLEAQLNEKYVQGVKGFEVINFACSGYSTAQEFVQYQTQVRQYKPDVTVILMHWGNTAASICNPKERRKAQPRPYFYLDNHGALQQDDSVLDWYYEPGSENTAWSKAIAFLQRNSRIYGVLTQTDMALNNNERLYFKWRGNFQRVLQFLQGKDPKAEPPGPSYPEQDAVKVTESIVTALGRQCTADGGKLVIMLLPDPTGGSEKLAKDLSTLGAENNFGLLDLSPDFKQAPNQKDLFLRVHLSSQGHQFVANSLQTYLTKNGLLSPGSAGVPAGF